MYVYVQNLLNKTVCSRLINFLFKWNGPAINSEITDSFECGLKYSDVSQSFKAKFVSIWNVSDCLGKFERLLWDVGMNLSGGGLEFNQRAILISHTDREKAESMQFWKTQRDTSESLVWLQIKQSLISTDVSLTALLFVSCSCYIHTKVPEGFWALGWFYVYKCPWK